MNVFHRHKPKHLAHDRSFTTRVLLGFLGAHAFFLPVFGTAAASEITKAGGGSTVTETNGVYSVYADKMSGENAFNRFSKFSLDGGNIANLYFRTNGATADANRLFNFVDGHIDINGTVNAIRNDAVGGQLFFLSPDGITVGAGGVINAGAINLLTPTKSAYESLRDSDLAKMAENVTGNRYAVNPEATIEIAGALHAVDGIKLRTANIKLAESAELRTGDATRDADGNVTAIAGEINFSDLVNTKNADGTELSAGINGGLLKASTDVNGDIVLSAIAASTATGPSENGAGEQVVTNFTPMTRTATVKTEDGSAILSRGSANIYATATNADEGWSNLEEGGYHVELANPLGQVVYTEADIQLGGDITAKDNIDIEATSSNEYKSDNDTSSIEAWERATGARWTNHIKPIKWLHDTLNVLPIYSYMDSEADVTVAKTAKLAALNAGGKGIGEANSGLVLSASSTAINKVYASSTSKEAELTAGTKAAAAGTDRAADTTTKEEHPVQTASGEKRTHLAGAAVSYDGAYSTADVTVDGTVKAKNDIAVTATSKTDVKAKASENGAPASSTSTSSKLNVAVAVLTGGNHSNVTIGEKGAVESTDGGITADAHTENKFETIASVTSNASSVGATAVGVNVFDGDATVAVDGTLTSAKDTTLSAFTDTPVDGVTVSNNTLPSPEQKKAQGTGLTPEEAKNTLADMDRLSKFLTKDNLTAIYNLCTKAAAEGEEKAPSTSIANKLGKYTDLLTIGASIGIGVGDMDADVKIGKTASIISGGTLDVKANALLEDIYMSSLSSMTNTNPDKDKLMAGAAVMVSDFHNDAHVTVADGTAAEHAKLQSAGTMTVAADSTQTYDRIGGIIYDLNVTYSGLVALTKSEEYQTLDASDKTAYEGTLKTVSKIIQDLNATKSVTGTSGSTRRTSRRSRRASSAPPRRSARSSADSRISTPPRRIRTGASKRKSMRSSVRSRTRFSSGRCQRAISTTAWTAASAMRRMPQAKAISPSPAPRTSTCSAARQASRSASTPNSRATRARSTSMRRQNRTRLC